MEDGHRKDGPNTACSTFPGWPTAATGLTHMRQKKYKVNSSIKQQPLMVASWNVHTLQDTGLGVRHRTAFNACDLARYNIDIAALSETRLLEEGSLVKMGTGYTLFWSGLPKDGRHIYGV